MGRYPSPPVRAAGHVSPHMTPLLQDKNINTEEDAVHRVEPTPRGTRADTVVVAKESPGLRHVSSHWTLIAHGSELG
jgi:hypothetical protein